MNEGKPFIKWVGGKSQLIKNIANSLPPNFQERKDITYIEPFVGGGAVLFWFLQNYPNIRRAIINDINPDLTNTYRVVRDTPLLLIELLSDLEKRYFAFSEEEERKNFFLEQRENYNYRCNDLVERAGLFIFLNRTCFNGLYRVNRKGLFNVPFGRYARPKICDRETLLADSVLLQRVEILTGDFAQTLDHATACSFFYFDPPYKPITQTSSFTSYAKEDFDDDDQKRLGAFCKEVNALGHSFVLSNSDPKNTDPFNNFFEELYCSFTIERVSASRMINSKGTGRGKISELLISN